MTAPLLLIAFIIPVALAFDDINGFHDASNLVATVVSTRALTPRQAVAWASAFSFIAAFGFGVNGATTVGASLGAAPRLSAVRWGIAGRMIWAWGVTIPVSGVIAGLAWLLLSH